LLFVGCQEIISATWLGAEVDGPGFKGDGREFWSQIRLVTRTQEQQSCPSPVQSDTQLPVSSLTDDACSVLVVFHCCLTYLSAVWQV